MEKMEHNHKGYFLEWHEAYEAGADASGGKGWNLGRLHRYGFTIPGGGVLSAAAYEGFLVENGLRELTEATAAEITAENLTDANTKRKLELLRERILGGIIPIAQRDEIVSKLGSLELLSRSLAVRSSASLEDSSGASFAGVHDSILNVKGIEKVFEAIKACYASLWTLRAVSYRRKMNVMDADLSLAVVIMEMVDPLAAGIGFTCNPQTGSIYDMVVNANYGLGESVVSGRIEPDEYHLDPRPALPEIKNKRIGRKEGRTDFKEDGGTKLTLRTVPPHHAGKADGHDESAEGYGVQTDQVLTDGQIVKLGLLLVSVLDAMGGGERHQDVEWAWDGERFILLQARPVTAMPRFTYPALKSQPDLWSNANFRDAIPMVLSTLGWDTVRSLTEHMLRTLLRKVGYSSPDGLQYTRRYQGRAYLNLTLLQWEYFDALDITPTEMNDITGGHQPEIDVRAIGAAAGSHPWSKQYRRLLLLFAIRGAEKRAEKTFAALRNRVGQWLKQDYRRLSDGEIIHTINKISEVALELVPLVMLLNSGSGFPFTMLMKALERDFPGRGRAMANILLMGRADITSAEHGYRLLEMAETVRNDPAARRFFSSEPFAPLAWKIVLPESSPFKKEFQTFLDQFGHRAVDETDIIYPRWREDPTYLLNVIRSMIDAVSSEQMKARQKESGAEVWREIERKVPFYKRQLIKWWVDQAIKGAEMRELGKSEMVRTGEPLRLVAQEIGRRFKERGFLERVEDIYHCSMAELVAILLMGSRTGQGLKALIAERKQMRVEQEALTPPDVIVDETPRYADASYTPSGEVLSGLGVAAGRATGEVRHIRHPDEGTKLKYGDVLVAPSTDPAWTPLFLKASAIVMETGGFLSHGAIVAREYGIPAVVNIPGVMHILQDGQRITVDGDEGKIYMESVNR